MWSPFSNLWLYDQTTDVIAARRHGVSVCLGSDWGPSGTKNLLGELKVAHTWVRHAGLDVTPFDLAEMVTSTPGDLLAGRGPVKALAACSRDGWLTRVVIAKRHDDPWTNLVLARERDVLLVVSDGQAALRHARADEPRPASTHDEHADRDDVAALRARDRPTTQPSTGHGRRCMDSLRNVQTRSGDGDRGRTGERSLEADVTTATTGRLILESDMPGGPNSVAGPPPPGTTFKAPPLPTLIHDTAWFEAVRDAGYHEHVLDDLDTLFADDAVLP